jgi:hypothetical protein
MNTDKKDKSTHALVLSKKSEERVLLIIILLVHHRKSPLTRRPPQRRRESEIRRAVEPLKERKHINKNIRDKKASKSSIVHVNIFK